jgi:hypothetical protein
MADSEHEFMKPVWRPVVPLELRVRFEALSVHINQRFHRNSTIPLYIDTILNSAKDGRITDKQMDKLELFVLRKK